jgi:hypothetical protein
MRSMLRPFALASPYERRALVGGYTAQRNNALEFAPGTAIGTKVRGPSPRSSPTWGVVCIVAVVDALDRPAVAKAIGTKTLETPPCRSRFRMIEQHEDQAAVELVEQRDRAQGLVEYGLIIALVAVLAIAGLVVFGPAVSSLLSKLGGSV